MKWTAVVPVKALHDAKSRLEGTDGPNRAELALAFAQDAISALLDCPQVWQIIAVVADQESASGLHSIGVTIVRESTGAGLNAAFRQGANLAQGPVLAMTADLPCVTAESLTTVLTAAGDHEKSMVSDAQGTGTTMLVSTSPHALNPQFGVRSCARHAHDGYLELARLLGDEPRTVELMARNRRDVDTAVDLWEAQRIGVGPHTRLLLDRLT